MIDTILATDPLLHSAFLAASVAVYLTPGGRICCSSPSAAPRAGNEPDLGDFFGGLAARLFWI